MSTLALPLIASRPSKMIPTVVLAAYVLLLVSRLAEFGGAVLGRNLPLMMICAVIALAIVGINGGTWRALSGTTGKLIAVFTVWLLITTLTSTWHGGSVSMLKDDWLRTLMGYVVVAGIITAFSQLRMVGLTIGWATAIAGVLSYVLGRSVEGRFGLDEGMVGNPNLLAFHLLYGLPFCFYVIEESGKLAKYLMYGAIVVMARVILGTGSRSGLITAAVLVAMVLVHASWINKIKLIVSLAAVVALGIGFVSSSALDRYRTLFSDDQSQDTTQTNAFRSAVASEESRLTHMKEGLALTFQHPILGVGPGVFVAAANDYELKEGLHQSWRETHNAYMQVSSECGIPGLLLYLAIIVSSWLTAFRNSRKAKETGNASFRRISFSLNASLAVFSAGAFFASDAYLFYLPLLAALTIAMEVVQNQEPRNHQPAMAASPKPYPTGRLTPVAAAAGIQAAGIPAAAAAPVPVTQPVVAGQRLGFGGYRRVRR